ncbi:MAG: AAA family ATPase [Candidatus Firestonebacteria bacterium GWA2_43_8]|nr:MAG: AAA family ATPase [Candidatus Firestonebacteria bacterium GWA2_43_8]
MADENQKTAEQAAAAAATAAVEAHAAAEAPVDDTKAVKMLKEARETILAELRKVIVGQEEVVDLMLIAIFSRGHSLLMGVPGLAKTLMVVSLSKVLNLSFKRIQFTPDLMPADITGTDIIEEDRATGRRIFSFIKGPLFANIVLADEINRTPPKTQAALLEAMQEHSVTAGGNTYRLEEPFFVLATQNPVEQEGTYNLPEAQLDRFMFLIVLDYPKLEEEVDIASRTTSSYIPELQQVLNGEQIMDLQALVRRVPISRNVIRYAVRLVNATRPTIASNPDFIKKWVSWGSGPRASQNLLLAGKARAILHGRYNVSCEDIAAIAPHVLRHRILTNFQAQAEGVNSVKIVEMLLKQIPTE